MEHSPEEPTTTKQRLAHFALSMTGATCGGAAAGGAISYFEAGRPVWGFLLAYSAVGSTFFSVANWEPIFKQQSEALIPED